MKTQIKLPNKLFIFAISIIFILTFNDLSQANNNIFIPYDFFNANIARYKSVISKQLLYDQITFDDIAPSVKYIDNKKLRAKSLLKIKSNRNLENIKDINIVKFGYTLRPSNMLLFPTNSILHIDDIRFDANQYHQLGTSSPVAILHTSKDNQFYFVQADIMRGWINKHDVNIYDEQIFRNIVSAKTIIIVKDNITIDNFTYRLGDKIPMLTADEHGCKIMLPNRHEYMLPKSDNFIKNIIKFDESEVEKLLTSLLGSPYDWGGKNGYRDCSALTRDLYIPFGIDLPRNTSMQQQLGKVLSDKIRSKDEFYDILDHAKAFRTLIFFKGHVMIYGGKSADDYIIYHSVNKLKNDDGKSIVFYKIVKNNLIKDKFTDIWKRVVKIIEI